MSENIPDATHPGAMAEAGRRLFDDNGRCLPGAAIAAQARSRRYFAFRQPSVDCREIYARTSQYLEAPQDMTESDFERRVGGLLERLSATPDLAAITCGVHVPFVLPRATHDDLGEALERHYLPALRRSFEARFPGAEFVDHSGGRLSQRLAVAPHSRHEHLLETLSRQSVAGCFFPCMTEYAVSGALAAMADLPPDFLLAGGFDTCAAMIGSPDLLCNPDGYSPALWLAGIAGETAQTGYHFEAYGSDLTFNRRAHLGRVSEYWSSALVVIG